YIILVISINRYFDQATQICFPNLTYSSNLMPKQNTTSIQTNTSQIK
ncbi:uncharacterized protein METZ01_LOCUS178572, partial [marine metagenome]